MGKIAVAVLGARGKLGTQTLKALVNPLFVESFSTILVVGTTPLDAELLSSLESAASAKGALVKTASVSYDDADTLISALKGIDFVVNVNNFPATEHSTHTRKSNILAAVKANGAKVYIPSEMGVDYRVNAFAQNDWKQKREHQLEARSVSGLKVVGIYTGLFLESAVGPWYGYDVQNKHFKVVGDPTVKGSRTSMQDVGLAVASLASIYAEKGASALPDHLRISGSSISLNEVADIFKQADPEHKDIQIETTPLDAYEKDLLSDPEKLSKGTPLPFILTMLGKGDLDLSVAPKDPSFKGKQGEAFGPNQTTYLNDFVNPGESKWTWKTVKDLASK